ncbi:MAG: hypothetical protein Sw2LagPseu_33850 [Shewanella algae]
METSPLLLRCNQLLWCEGLVLLVLASFGLDARLLILLLAPGLVLSLALGYQPGKKTLSLVFACWVPVWCLI